jgi:hypothetical protein
MTDVKDLRTYEDAAEDEDDNLRDAPRQHRHDGRRQGCYQDDEEQGVQALRCGRHVRWFPRA